MRALWLIVLSCLVCGCNSGPSTPPQTFELGKPAVKVEFSPPVGWKQRKPDAKDTEHKLQVFEHPSGNGVMAVGVVPEVKLDKAFLNQLGLDIVQNKGRIVGDKWIDVAGGKENGYRMEFEVNSGVNRGLQLHFLHDDRMLSVVMTVPSGEFAKSQQQFDQLVRSLKFPGS